MRLLLQTVGANVADWHAAFRAALPEADISIWPDVARPSDYVAVWKPPPALFAAAAGAKAIFNLGAGVDALLANPALPTAIPVIRLEDCGMAEQMRDYIVLAVLAAFREQREYADQQGEAAWLQRPAPDRSAFGVGFLGFGLLARAAADALAPFGFPLAGWSRTRKAPSERANVATFAGLDELPAFLARCRALVCLLPSTPSTRDFLDRTRLELLPHGAHVVNVARGDVVVERDLIAALDNGQVAGATLDVFRDEPLPAAHPFWHHPRVTVTPHVSALTLPMPSAAQIAAKIRRLERGLDVTGVVDRAHGY